MSLTEGWWFYSLLLNQISSFVAGELILRVVLSREMHGAKMDQACIAAFTFLYHGCLLHPDSLCTPNTQTHFVVIYMQTHFALIDGLSRTHTAICFSTTSQCNASFVCLVEHATDKLQTYTSKTIQYRLCSRYIGTVCMSIFKYYSCWGMVVDINVGKHGNLFPLRTGLLIGSQGAKIKELRRDSGCKACGKSIELVRDGNKLQRIYIMDHMKVDAGWTVWRVQIVIIRFWWVDVAFFHPGILECRSKIELISQTNLGCCSVDLW